MEDGTLRPFSPQEIEEHDKNSVMTKLFGDEKEFRNPGNTRR